VEHVISSFHPDVIVHAAAYTNVDQAETDQKIALQVNETGTRHIADAAKQHHARLIHISTDYVFDGTKTTPYTEEDPPCPLGIYGETKLRAEQQVQHILENQDFLILRTAWLYGKHGKNFVSTILRLAQQHKTLRIVNDQTGSPTYTRDFARAISALLGKKAFGIVHLTNTGQCTWYEFTKTILDFAGITGVAVQPITAEELGRPAPRPGFSVLDTLKFTILTGQTIRHWKDGLREYLEEVEVLM
jgi:dTDP-4-dehydrorhamnose reductase